VTDSPQFVEVAPGVAVRHTPELDENGHAKYGEVAYTRPSAEELDAAALRVRAIRHNLSVLRGEVEQLETAWAPTRAGDQRYRDVQGLLTAALVMLYDAEDSFPRWAERKREKLAHPETYVVKEGFGDQRSEDGLVKVLWWDDYHTRFGPNLCPMPWREPNERAGD
jgi:hypothetical protein